MEKYLPKSVIESNILKKKDLKKLIFQNLTWFFEKQFFNKTSIQIEYLKCMNELLQFSGRIYFVNLLVSIHISALDESALVKTLFSFKGTNERNFYHNWIKLWNSHFFRFKIKNCKTLHISSLVLCLVFNFFKIIKVAQRCQIRYNREHSCI